jgi:uncharacterized membrane protein YcaP (DUF421 family)
MNNIIQDILVPGIPIIEKIVRPIIVYVFLIVALRLAGKREMAQMNAFDLVVLLTLSNAVQNAIIGNDNSVSGGVIGATTLLVINAIAVRLIYRSQKADALIEGDATELVKDGEFQDENMRREVITEHELMSAIRRQGIDDVSEVKSAILETNGNICVIARHPTPEESATSLILERLERIEAQLQNVPK